MLPLKHPWFWAAVGWLLVGGVVVGSFVPGPSLQGVDFVGDKWLHAATYGLLMLWFGGLYPRRRHALIALGLFAFGCVLDALQGVTETRSFDFRDIAANGSGILIGLVLTATLLEGWCQRLERRMLAPTS